MKTRRQKKILEIIEKYDIATQEELAAALVKAGFEVTQATVSRDIKELGLIKIPIGKNVYKYGIPGETGLPYNQERLRRMLQELVIGIDFSENLIVMKTYPGNAQSVASLIDGAKWPEVIGTVAGDDTLLLVVKDPQGGDTKKTVELLLQKLKSLME